MEHSNVLIADGKLFVYAMQKASGDARPIYIQMYDLDLVPVDTNLVINFKTPVSGQTFEYGVPVKVEASAGDSIKSLALMVDSISLRTIQNGEFIWGLDSLVDSELFTLSEGLHSLKLIGFNGTDSVAEKTITIKVNNAPVPQGPFQNVAVAIPGKIEAENYDVGGEGLAYHDSDDSNESLLYRDDGVDIIAEGTEYCIDNMINKEWQEYTIDVSEDGLYDIVISYASGLTSGNARIGVSLPDENRVIVDNFRLYDTFAWDNFMEETIASEISLTKGIHILRSTVVQFGYYLDWIKIVKEGATGIDNLVTAPVSVFPNPSSTGEFNLNRNISYSVYSIDGLKIKSGTESIIDLSAYPKGIYILKTETSVHKIIHK
jgi:hypothetical protein